MVLEDLAQHLLIDLPDQVLKAHHAAFPGLEGFSVLPVHGSESEEVKAGLLLHQLCLARTAENLREIQFLPLIHHIDDLIRIPVLHPHDDCSQVRCIVKGGSVRFENHTGRDLLGIRLLRHVNDQGPLVRMGVTVFLQIADEARNVGLRVRFFLPEFEFHIQAGIIPLQILDGHPEDMLPEGMISFLSLLKLVSRLQCLFFVFFVLFRLQTGGRIDLLKLGNGKRRFRRIVSFPVIVEIRKIRLPVLQLRDDQSHLKAPVAQMHVADRPVAGKMQDPLDALPDYGGTQMPYMKGLRHISSAIVDDHGLRLSRFFCPQILIRGHRGKILAQERAGELQVEKSGSDSLHRFKSVGILQDFRHILRDHQRRLMIAFCACHGPVALVFAQIRAVGHLHFPQFRIIARRLKSLCHIVADQV